MSQVGQPTNIMEINKYMIWNVEATYYCFFNSKSHIINLLSKISPIATSEILFLNPCSCINFKNIKIYKKLINFDLIMFNQAKKLHIKTNFTTFKIHQQTYK